MRVLVPDYWCEMHAAQQIVDVELELQWQECSKCSAALRERYGGRSGMIKKT